MHPFSAYEHCTLNCSVINSANLAGTSTIFPLHFPHCGVISKHTLHSICPFTHLKFNKRHLSRGFWFLVLGADAFHRKESGYPYRDFASRPDRAYKMEIQIMACLFQDLQIGNPDNCLGKGGILRPVLS